MGNERFWTRRTSNVHLWLNASTLDATLDYAQIVAVTPRAPRNFLLSPKQFGKLSARWRDDYSPEQTGKLGAAWYQHCFVSLASDEIARKYTDNLTAFAEALADRFGVGSDPQDVQRKFRGARFAQMDDYMLWIQLIGNRCLPVYADRKAALPPSSLVGERPRRRAKA